MILVNRLPWLMLLTDAKIAGVSVIAEIRAELLAVGRLEDLDDDITVLPGESLQVAVTAGAVDELWWIEP